VGRWSAPLIPETVDQEIVPQRVGVGVPIFIFGELFALDRDLDLGFVIEHPKWSLLGYGETIRQAEQHLIERGKVLATIMQDDFPLELSSEGRRFCDFVTRLLYIRVVSFG